MKVHTLQIPPEGRRIEGEDPSAMLDLHDDQIVPLTPVHQVLDVGLSEGGLFATGELKVDLRLQCVACLETFRYPVRIEDFACQVELNGSEMIDLTEPVREDILLVLPPHPHCDWNGEKVCAGLTPEAASIPEPEVKPDVWNALDHLNLK
ncbi:MAG: hypothetical protein ABI680_13310 [Chthoniobacteraceae bacterium]